MSLRFAKDELRYYVFTGRTPMKKMKTLNFKAGVPGPVWDRKIHALMTRLPYFRFATEAEIAAIEGKAAPVAAVEAVKPAPKPVAPKTDERDELRAQLDALSIGYDKRWNVANLRAALLAATPAVTAQPEMAEAVNG